VRRDGPVGPSVAYRWPYRAPSIGAFIGADRDDRPAPSALRRFVMDRILTLVLVSIALSVAASLVVTFAPRLIARTRTEADASMPG